MVRRGSAEPLTLPDGHAQHAFLGMQWAFVAGLLVIGGFVTGGCCGITMILMPFGLLLMLWALWRMTRAGPLGGWQVGWRLASRGLIVALGSWGALMGAFALGELFELHLLMWSGNVLASALLMGWGAPVAGALTLALTGTLSVHVARLVDPTHPLRVGWPLAMSLLGLPLGGLLISAGVASATPQIALAMLSGLSLAVTSCWLLLRSGKARRTLRSLRPEPAGAAHARWQELANAVDLDLVAHEWGIELIGTGSDGIELRMTLETCIAPVRLRIEVPVPSLQATERGRGIWLRRRQSEAAAPVLNDPVLDGALEGGGEGVADLVRGLHATLLEALHGQPGTELRDGVLQLELPHRQTDLMLEPVAMEQAPKLVPLTDAVRALRRLAAILHIEGLART